MPFKQTHFKNGQAPIPDKVYQFFLTLISENPRIPSERDVRLANSVASGAMYNVTNGHVKPAKQLCMGVGIKSTSLGMPYQCLLRKKLLQKLQKYPERGEQHPMVYFVKRGWLQVLPLTTTMR